jgi:hypothetical protein
MSQSTSTTARSSSRPVLLWQEEGDITRVEPTIEQAAEFLKVNVADVRLAIEGGDVLDGWFADWQAEGAQAAG